MKTLFKAILFQVVVAGAFWVILALYGVVSESIDSFLYDTRGYYVEGVTNDDGTTSQIIHVKP